MRFGLRELVFLMVLLSVPVASFIFVFKPRNEEIQRASREVEIKTAKLEQLHEVSSRIEDIGSAIAEWQRALEEVEGKLPDRQGIDVLLEEVWHLTVRNNLEVLATKTESVTTAGSYMELPLKIEMRGNFDGFYQFLLQLEQLQRITRIHQMKIARPGKNKKRNSRSEEQEFAEGGMEVEFTLSIFYESEDFNGAS